MTGSPDLSSLRRDTSPAVRAPRRSTVSRVVVPALLLASFAGLAWWAGRDAWRPRLEVRTVAVVVKPGSAAGATAVTRAAGWIEPDPFAIPVTSLVDGVVTEIRVVEGDRVEAGQVIAVLDPKVAESEVRKAKELERAARAELALAEAARRGDLFTLEAGLVGNAAAAATRAREAESERDAAVRDEASARAAADGAAERAHRAEAERAGGSGSKSAAAEAASAAREAALAADAAAGRREAAERRLEEARRFAAASDVARAARVFEGRTPEMADLAVTIAEANARCAELEAAAAQLVLDRHEVRAPAAGVVLERLAAPGTRLSASSHGTGVATLYDPARLLVRTDIPLGEAAKVGAGQKARVTVESLPGRTIDGEVIRIVPLADAVKNTVQAKVRIAAPDAAMRPGMLARVEFLAVPGKEAPAATTAFASVFAPERLLRRDGDRGAAWVVEDGRAVRRDVRIGAGRDGEWVEVTEGLRPGDDLIDTDPSLLEDGRAVRVAGDRR